MEQHPVPRNISGFQFHLIGDMTLRQFAYLAAGAFAAYLIYKAAPFSGVINIPLALTFGFAGFALAFLPIAERPLDKWILAFIKSIMSPTQYLWHKNNQPPDILTRSVAIHIQVSQPQYQALVHKETNEKLRAYLATLPVPIHETLNAAEKRYIDRTLALFQTSAVVSTSAFQPISSSSASNQPAANKPAPLLVEPIAKPPPIEKKDSAPVNEKGSDTTPKTVEIPAPQIEPIPIPVTTNENHTILRNQLTSLTAEKAALEKELQRLRQQLSNVNTPVSGTPQQTPIKETIKAVSLKSTISDMGMLNFQQAANLIAGVIKDPQRKLLPNIILTIKDKSELPVRALKTNKLGQFTTATSLANGTYFLEVEDPMKRYVFDIIQIALSGKVFLPIEIIARGEKELMREKLSKELFGSSVM